MPIPRRVRCAREDAPVTPERWQEIKDLLMGAMGRSSAERAAYLDEVCGADATLRQEVESLLAAGGGY